MFMYHINLIIDSMTVTMVEIKLSYHCIVLLWSLSHFSIVRNYHILLQFNALF